MKAAVVAAAAVAAVTATVMMVSYSWYFVTKTVLTYCEKKLF